MHPLHSLRRLAALLCLPLLFSFAAGATAQAPKPVRSDVGPDSGSSILWVGNSFFYYNNSMSAWPLEMALKRFCVVTGTHFTCSGETPICRSITPMMLRHRSTV